MTPVPLVAVYGTAGGDFHVGGEPCTNTAHWWHQSSGWWGYMRGLGFAPLCEDEFVWSGDLNGVDVLNVVRPWVWGKRTDAIHKDWYSAGRGYKVYQKAYGVAGVNVAHSHGGQGMLYAAAFGATLPVLITIATPHRSDMDGVIEKALPNIGRWVHVCDRSFDAIAQAGEFGDGTVSFSRTQPKAHVNITLDRISHSELLQNPTKFAYWRDQILGAAGIPLSAVAVGQNVGPAT